MIENLQETVDFPGVPVSFPYIYNYIIYIYIYTNPLIILNVSE